MHCCKFFSAIIFIFSLFSAIPAFCEERFWEYPAQFTKTDSRFPSVISGTADSRDFSVLFYEDVDDKKSAIYLSAKITRDGKTWTDIPRFAGPYSYVGAVPDQYAAAVNDSGRLCVAVITGIGTLSVFSADVSAEQLSFSETKLQAIENPFLAPRIYKNSRGGFTLFSSQGQENSFSMLMATSENGVDWSNFESFQPSESTMNPFLPVLFAGKDSAENTVDKVIFQAQYNNGNRLVYQLYKTEFNPDAKTWSPAVLISDENSFFYAKDRQKFDSYNNQRPSVFSFDGKTYVAWERSYAAYDQPHIWFSEFDGETFVKNSIQELTSSGSARRPILFKTKSADDFSEKLAVVWFDNRRGFESVFFGEYENGSFDGSVISRTSVSSSFAYPVISGDGTELSFVWQQNASQKGKSNLYILEKDHSVPRPVLSGISFSEGKRYTAKRASAKIIPPDDSSGIAGYSWIFTQDKNAEVPAVRSKKSGDTKITANATADGFWYFKARAQDFAGNWSDAGSISYFRDTTPPLKPIVTAPKNDGAGFAASNTFSVRWTQNPADTDVAGYTWALQYIAGEPKDEKALAQALKKNASKLKSQKPPQTFMGKKQKSDYQNLRNGIYVFSVAAIDTVGNIGKSENIFIALNKYEAQTSVTAVEVDKNEFNEIFMTILGNDFTYHGTISEIYIDRDGSAPYDKILRLSDGDYVVNSTNRISAIRTRDLDEGDYRVGLFHTERGVFFTKKVFHVEQNGTVKFENEFDYKPLWKPFADSGKKKIDMPLVIFCLLFALAFLAAIAAGRGMQRTIIEMVWTKNDIIAIEEGKNMPRKKQVSNAKKHFSLRLKLVLFTVILVIMVVLLVALPLGFFMTRTQEKTLASGLSERVEVLLESLSSGVKAYLPLENILELSNLPAQISALPEAISATISGIPSGGGNTNLDYVWATNDEHISEKIDSELQYGISRFTDETLEKISLDFVELNAIVTEQAGAIADSIAELNAEGAELALNDDAESEKRMDELSTITMQLSARLTKMLSDISSNTTSSYPPYDDEIIDPSQNRYIFYKPVLYRQGSEQNYIRGIIFITVDTSNLIRSVANARKTVIFTSLSITIIAVIIGAIGALLVASVIVNPVKKLEKHVAMISGTKDKMKLAGKDIAISSNDEIASLGEKINEMTHGLVKAAEEEQLMMDGKSVQQAFLPLLPLGKGKMSISEFKGENLHFFGYYEGASLVSGDYFDYKMLDKKWFAVIKCDASGHGVPAALIVTVVATFFRKYFENWSFAKNGTRIGEVVLQINEFLATLGLQGKFAAICLCLINTQTSEVYVCNAGDNIVHIYDGEQKKMIVRQMFPNPAAGNMSAAFVRDVLMQELEFKVEKIQLKADDVLFLYTDGIEESTRKYRDSDFNEISEEEITDEGTPREHTELVDHEQMENERIHAIIEAVKARGTYVLEKKHNPLNAERLEFDFSSCDGNAQDIIIALASVEKVFRFYKPSDATASDTVRCDKKIDDFLQKHFNRYDFYCSQKNEAFESPVYVEYTFLREDEQLDDLTLLCASRF